MGVDRRICSRRSLDHVLSFAALTPSKQSCVFVRAVPQALIYLPLSWLVLHALLESQATLEWDHHLISHDLFMKDML